MLQYLKAEYEQRWSATINSCSLKSYFNIQQQRIFNYFDEFKLQESQKLLTKSCKFIQVNYFHNYD